MLEVPFLDEIVRDKTHETAQRYIVAFLEARFGDVPRDLVEEIEAIDDEKQLRRPPPIPPTRRPRSSVPHSRALWPLAPASRHGPRSRWPRSSGEIGRPRHISGCERPAEAGGKTLDMRNVRRRQA